MTALAGSIDGNTIQLPNINSRAAQRVMIPDGVLVLSGFEQTTSRMDKTGTVRDNWLMGGRSSGSLGREVMVMPSLR